MPEDQLCPEGSYAVLVWSYYFAELRGSLELKKMRLDCSRPAKTLETCSLDPEDDVAFKMQSLHNLKSFVRICRSWSAGQPQHSHSGKYEQGSELWPTV